MKPHLLFLQRRRFLSSAAASAADVAGEIAALLAAGKHRASATRAQKFLRSNCLPTHAAGASEVPDLYRAIAAAAPADAPPSYLSAAATALVEASTRASLPEGALRLLSHVAKMPAAPLPSGSSCSLLLRKLLPLGRYTDVRDAFGMLAAAGERLDTDAWNAVVKACVMAGDIDEALRRIREMGRDGKPRPDASLCNTVLNALWTAGRGDDAVKVFGEMADMAVAPDQATYNAMFDGYRKSGDLEAASEVLARMTQEGFKLTKTRRDRMPRILAAAGSLRNEVIKVCIMAADSSDAGTYTKVLKSLWGAWRGDDAVKLFGEMTAMAVEPNETTYIAMIDGYAKSGDLEAASQLRTRMSQDGFELDRDRVDMLSVLQEAWARPDNITGKWNEVIKYCTMTRDIDGAVRRLRWLGRNGAPRPDARSYTLVIFALWIAKRGDDAVKVFNEMADMAIAPDCHTYDAMIEGYLYKRSSTTMVDGDLHKCSSSEELDAALELRARMVQEGLKPSESTYRVLARQLKLAKRMGDVAALFHDVVAQQTALDMAVAPDQATYSAMLDRYRKRKDLDAACEVLSRMSQEGFKLTNYYHDRMPRILNALWRAGRGGDAIKVFGEMAGMAVAPDEAMYDAMIDGYLKNGDLEAASELWTRMSQDGFELDRSRVCMLNTLTSDSEWPDFTKWKKVIQYCIKTGDIDGSISALRRMGHDGAPRPDPLFDGTPRQDTCLCNMVINALWKARKGDDAVKVFNEMADMAIAPDRDTYTFMIYVCLSKTSGGLDAALELLARMVQEGFKPQELIYYLLASKLCDANRMGDLTALFHGMLTQGMTLETIIQSSLFVYLIRIDEDMLLGIIEESVKKGDEPMDESCCIKLLDGLFPKVSTAEKVLWRLRMGGLMPTREMYFTLICRYCRIGDLKGAFSLCSSMEPFARLTPAVIYRALALGFRMNPRITKWMDVVELFGKNGQRRLGELTSESPAVAMGKLQRLYSDEDYNN
ncbi:hypothetical protein ACP70R_044204 [Stipagrostis hirtigluma subsp. patula]